MPKKTDRALVLKKLKISWHKAFSRLIPLGGFSSQNRLKIFHSGDDAFAAIHDAMSSATSSIYVETYCIAADRVGVWLRDAMIDARKRGVHVTILYDHFGSAGLTTAFLAPMIASGVKVLAFNPIWAWRRRGPLLFRDHRKIIVVDEKLAFCGSMNLTADYAGPIYGNNRFRDTMARIEGPAVADLLKITLESIAEAEFEKAPDELTKVAEQIDKSLAIKEFVQRLLSPSESLKIGDENMGTLVQVLRSNKRRNLAHIQNSLEEAVNRAVSYCYFTTPYFLPHEGLLKAMINAARRGVDVRVLTAGMSDVPLMQYANRHVYKSLLEHNVRIYEMTHRTLHAKIATIDGVYSTIGSYNLDHWSARRNLEVNLSIIDQATAFLLKEQFHKDLELCHEIERTTFLARSWFHRLISRCAYFILRL